MSKKKPPTKKAILERIDGEGEKLRRRESAKRGAQTRLAKLRALRQQLQAVDPQDDAGGWEIVRVLNETLRYFGWRWKNQVLCMLRDDVPGKVEQRAALVPISKKAKP
jgi:hypothetical protein